ncbi:hypothetical protein FDP41_008170 [Naegleria fowleri]|uniref:Uncharacterized protein n=1 Tax=Naegleria fowleri TaxID=5763 RepID=A0A6A5BFQ8_NAEFO|nr:uncharacterized protein FDP41_008170 [Naegleria fowleri]KAF0973466.1 hypothetical protein FDP41_008170 [Naegleria fowleri]
MSITRESHFPLLRHVFESIHSYYLEKEDNNNQQFSQQQHERDDVKWIQNHQLISSLLLKKSREKNSTTVGVVNLLKKKNRKKSMTSSSSSSTSSLSLLAHYDEYKRLDRLIFQQVFYENLKFKNQVIYKPLLESLHQLMNYLNYYLNHDENRSSNIPIEDRKRTCIEEYQSVVIHRYGNIYKISTMIENVESLECLSDLTVYNKMMINNRQILDSKSSSHIPSSSFEEHRMDDILQVLEYHQCVFNEPIILYNDSQLYKYLNLCIHYGNLYENVKYIQQSTTSPSDSVVVNIPHKIIHFVLCRHCKTVYNNFQRYKFVKIRILNSYISYLEKYSTSNKHETFFKLALNSYIQYMMDCRAHFIKYGHLKTMNQRFQKVIPKLIKHVLTMNTHNFKECQKDDLNMQTLRIDYLTLMQNISLHEQQQDHSQEIDEHYSSQQEYNSREHWKFHSFLTNQQQQHTNELVASPMQIHKFIETNSTFYLTTDWSSLFETYGFMELESHHGIQISKLYEYLIYKYGYYNNDWILEKYNEMIHEQLIPYIRNRIQNTILSSHMNVFTREFPYLSLLLRGAFPHHFDEKKVFEISLQDPQYKEHLNTLKQYILRKTNEHESGQAIREEE